MVGSRKPEGITPLHAAPANQNVLKRIVQRVADVKRARDVGRRNDDRIGLSRRVGGGAEVSPVDPILAPPSLDGLRFIRFIELPGRHKDKTHADKAKNLSMERVYPRKQSPACFHGNEYAKTFPRFYREFY